MSAIALLAKRLCDIIETFRCTLNATDKVGNDLVGYTTRVAPCPGGVEDDRATAGGDQVCDTKGQRRFSAVALSCLEITDLKSR